MRCGRRRPLGAVVASAAVAVARGRRVDPAVVGSGPPSSPPRSSADAVVAAESASSSPPHAAASRTRPASAPARNGLTATVPPWGWRSRNRQRLREPPLPRGSGCRTQGQATGLVRALHEEGGFTVAGQCRDLTGLRWVLRPVATLPPRRSSAVHSAAVSESGGVGHRETSSARSRNGSAHMTLLLGGARSGKSALAVELGRATRAGDVRRHLAADRRRPAGTASPATAPSARRGRPSRNRTTSPLRSPRPATTSSCSTASRCG